MSNINAKERLALDVLAAGRVDGPPTGPWRRDHAYPLALDIDDAHGIAAVSFAILDMYPKIERGWWCEAITFARCDGQWEYAGGDTDNTTAPDPFSRPDKPAESVLDWCGWHSNGGISGWDEDHPPEWRNTFFGIAPRGTARLAVTDETGRTRDLRITPWNGAYVAVVAGIRSTLTGFDDAGRELGSFMPVDGFTEPEDPEPPPGWEKVEDAGGNMLFVRRNGV